MRGPDEKVDMTEEELTRNLVRSSAGGKHAALAEVVQLLLQKAGSAFSRDRDEEARTVRELAREVEEMRRKAWSELTVLNAAVR
jgi:hypothetical protein